MRKIHVFFKHLYGFTNAGAMVNAPSAYSFNQYLSFLYSLTLGVTLSGCLDEPLNNKAPEIISVPTDAAQVNVEYSYEVVAIDEDNDPLIHALDDKPDGMAINAVTGRIVWIPENAGVFNVAIMVDDTEGHRVRQRYSITVDQNDIEETSELSGQALSAFGYLYDIMDQFHHTFDVYTDFARAGNHYIPSGWMGHTDGLSLNENWTDDCHAGDSCIRVAYTPGGVDWAGIYWQTPENNWGTIKDAGHDLTGAKALTFMAKGGQGGENISFLLGGIKGSYPDSVQKKYTEGCVNRGSDCYVTLSDSWQEYTIHLEGEDISHVVGGFAFVTDTLNNPEGAVFYIDEIKYDKPRLDHNRLLVSYETFPTTDPDRPDVHLRTPAFVYDNAVVALALLSRGGPEDLSRAKLIVDALLYAQNNDRVYADGRLRNAYRGGDLIDHMTGKARLAIWWDAVERKWKEDELQVSTHIGNLAWAAMAMLGYYEQAGGNQYLDGAVRLAEWIERETRDDGEHGGYIGGLNGRDGFQEKIKWKSTEHNIDVYIAFSWLEKLTGELVWGQRAGHARLFLASMWNDQQGHFWTGTDDNGETSQAPIPVDIQAWAALAMEQYEDALDWAINNLSVTADGFSGFDFNEDRDGIWFEGTAQMVVGFKKTGKSGFAGQYLDQLRQARISATNTNGKGIVAASHDGVSTGFEDWFLYSRLHIAATAWYLFAEMGRSPWDFPVNIIIDSHPEGISNSDMAIFEFYSTKSNDYYQCRIDGEAYVDCVSPAEYSGLVGGEHVFCVRGMGLDFETESKSTCYSWIIE